MPDFTSITFPAWVYSDAMRAFLLGLIVGASIRILRAGLRWFKKAGTDTND